VLAELIDPRVAADGGRVVKTTGDGVLIEFPSAVDAVRNALAIQSAMAQREANQPEDRRMTFRIGVNVGDVIVEGDDIHGDGVNVAARLEGLCEPGAVYISATVHDHVHGKLEASFDDLGERSVKNISAPIRVYRVGPGGAEAAFRPASLGASAIAVLPFENMSGDAEQEFFADGLTEDIITALSGSHAFPVIARNSTFAYKGQSPDLRKVANELGVRYLIEGSVRKGGNRIRINAQLIDGATGQHIWAEVFDRDLADIFDVQDEITGHIAATIEPALERIEGKRLAARRAQNIDAWGYYQRAVLKLQEYTKEGNRQAREHAQMAIEIDPDYALAHVALANSHYRDLRTGKADDEDHSENELFKAARKAVELNNMSAETHYAMGLAYQISGQYELSIAELGRSLELNPYNTWVRFALGGTLTFFGRPKDAVVELEKAFELNPKDGRLYTLVSLLARAHLNAGNYEDAVSWGRRAISFRADTVEAHFIVTSALGHLGQIDDAGRQLAECERLRPGSTKSGLFGGADSFNKQSTKEFALAAGADRNRNEHYLEGLRKAGLSE
jgi:adenylate cyclase